MTRCRAAVWALVLATAVAVTGCPEAGHEAPPIDTPTPDACAQGNVVGVPIVALEWSSLRETYLSPAHEGAHLGVDYLVSPAAHVDQVELRFDFDPLVTTDTVTFDGVCRPLIPLETLTNGTSPDAEDVVSATVIARSSFGGARTGRVFASTGTRSLDLRTDGLDAGDPEDGRWWAIFEPAAGRARLVIAPAALDRTTFRLTGVPTDQPGIVALIQTPALEFDAGTQTVYAPWGFAGDWRRYARAWHQALLWHQTGELIDLSEVVPSGANLQHIHRARNGVALTDGALREFRVLSSAESGEPLEVACDVAALTVEVLSFSEVTLGIDAEVVAPGEAQTFTGFCERGMTSWSLPTSYRSLNGRASAVLLSRSEEVSP